MLVSLSHQTHFVFVFVATLNAGFLLDASLTHDPSGPQIPRQTVPLSARQRATALISRKPKNALESVFIKRDNTKTDGASEAEVGTDG